MSSFGKERLKVSEWMNRGGGYSYSDLYLLGQMEQYFIDIQIELGKVSDGINYSSCQTSIDRIYTDKTSLECYINCLPSDIDEKIDQPFTMKVSDIMDYLCTIDATKIKTDNIVDLKKNVSYTGISYEKEKLDYLTLEHFVGSSHKTKDAISHCNYDKFTHDDYVDEYTKIFKDTYASEYKKYLDDKGNFSEQDFLDSLVIEESYYKKKSGYVEELLESLGQLTIILPVVEGVLNREVFTEDRTTDDEAAGKINNAMIQLFTFGHGAIASKGIGALRTLAVSVAGDVTATTISVTGERLKLPRGLTMAMAFIAANGVQNGMIKTFKTPGGRTIEIGGSKSAADASKNIKYKEIKTFSAEETNQWFVDNVKPDYKPPYKPGTLVKEIELTEKTTFVRVYDNMPDGSGMYGSWVMKADDIKGLTPLEIQDKFALPNTPKYICDVELEAGTHIRVGEVNPLDGWGKGGGTQYDLIGQRIGDFKNERVLEGK